MKKLDHIYQLLWNGFKQNYKKKKQNIKSNEKTRSYLSTAVENGHVTVCFNFPSFFLNFGLVICEIFITTVLKNNLKKVGLYTYRK